MFHYTKIQGISHLLLCFHNLLFTYLANKNIHAHELLTCMFVYMQLNPFLYQKMVRVQIRHFKEFLHDSSFVIVWCSFSSTCSLLSNVGCSKMFQQMFCAYLFFMSYHRTNSFITNVCVRECKTKNFHSNISI